MEGKNVYLKPDEAKFISMAVLAIIEDLETTSKDVNINWNPSARKDLKEMITAGNSLKVKLENLGLDMRDLPPYLDSDKDDYLTKQS